MEMKEWLDNFEFKNSDFVPAGFEFMDKNIIDAIDNKLNKIKPSAQIPDRLRLKEFDFFYETSPYFVPFNPDKSVWNFDYGERVINVCT